MAGRQFAEGHHVPPFIRFRIRNLLRLKRLRLGMALCGDNPVPQTWLKQKMPRGLPKMKFLITCACMTLIIVNPSYNHSTRHKPSSPGSRRDLPVPMSR